jgi:tetratricopeptide (TPR) repeat protein
MSRGVDQTGLATGAASNTADALKQNLIGRIALAEAAVRQAEAAHESTVVLSRTYVQLGLCYQSAAQWGRAEAALDHAVSLRRQRFESGADLATALSQLGTLHVMMDKLRDSEREEEEALKLRLGIGDPLQIARSRYKLAILYLAKQKYEKARDLARQAEAEINRNGRADVFDRVTARVTLAEALCDLKDWPSAISLLKAALDEAKAMLHPYDFPVGLSNFLLGYAYWKSGNMSEAEEYMKTGTDQMSVQLGWRHPAYVRALTFYARFLHDNRQVEAANIVERRIHQAEAVVDVHSIQTAQGMFGISGLR